MAFLKLYYLLTYVSEVTRYKAKASHLLKIRTSVYNDTDRETKMILLISAYHQISLLAMSNITERFLWLSSISP